MKPVTYHKQVSVVTTCTAISVLYILKIPYLISHWLCWHSNWRVSVSSINSPLIKCQYLSCLHGTPAVTSQAISFKIFYIAGGEGQWREEVTSQDAICKMRRAAACWTAAAAAILLSTIMTRKWEWFVASALRPYTCLHVQRLLFHYKEYRNMTTGLLENSDTNFHENSPGRSRPDTHGRTDRQKRLI